MRFPIETNSSTFDAAGPAEPVLDFGTKTAKSHEQVTSLVSVPHDCAGVSSGLALL